MNKTKIILIAIGMLTFGALAVSGQTNSCPDIAPYLCNNGSCTNDPALCNQSWGGGLNTESSPDAPLATTTTLVSIVNSGEKCTGNLRYDRSATEACAALAEAQGRALGYDISCSVETRPELIIIDANPVGDRVSYAGSCTINGVSGHAPETLAGYRGSGTGFLLPGERPGSTNYGNLIYGEGYNLNSMWYSVPCELADAAQGSSGTLVGAATCTSGAKEYFGSNRPANWTPANARTNRINSNTPPSSRVPANARILYGSGANQADGTGSTSGTGFGSQFNQLLVVVNRLLEQARVLYGREAFQNISVPTPTTPTGTTPATGTTLPSYIYNLSIDKTSYCVGEKPLYTVSGGANLVGSKVLWSSRLNNVATQELDSDYGYVLRSQAGGSYWSAYGNIWTLSDVGIWEKEANVNNILKKVNFEVKACTTKPLVCSPKTQTVSKYSVAYLTVVDTTNPSFNWTGTYNWSAPSSTKNSGVGINFGTSYANAGTYNITASGEEGTDTCQVTVY